MRFQQHPSPYVLSLVAIGFAVLVGILIPLISGGNPGPAQADWTPPPARTVDTTTIGMAATISPPATPKIVPTNSRPPAKLAAQTSTPAAPTRAVASQSQATPTPAQAATVPATARILKGPANLRAGPGTRFTILAVANEGAEYPITGRSEDNLWFQVCCIGTTPVWLSAALADVPAAAKTYPVVR